MDIDWGAFGSVFAVSLGITLVTVVLFSLGIAAWPRDDGEDGEHARAIRAAGTAAAVLCFSACLAVAGYGLALIVGP
ncbi:MULTISPECIES: hypothetical protein [Streptomyces]|uniref:hypothetical protein n=1 Tax=Streptomyces TaxID=1883 RepID=UPI00292D6C8A|nr:hypothetical protein [Streptomyces sp. NEAU-HV9]